MDKKKIFTLVGIVLVAAGVVLGMFAFPAANITGFAVAVLGAGIAAYTLWKSRKEGTPKWVSIVSMILIGIGALVAGFLGLFDKEDFPAFIGYIIAAVVFIAGLLGYHFIPKALAKKEDKKVEKK